MKRKICYITTIAVTIRAFFIPQLKFLAENGFEVVVITSPDDKLQEDLGENIRYIPITIERGISPATLLKSILDLKKIFREENFDIVQYSTPNAAFCASIAAKMAGVKIRNYHLMGLRYLGMSGVMRSAFKTLEKITCKLSTHIECITKSNLELSVNEGLFKREKTTMVWNGSTGGVDLERFSASDSLKYRDEIRKEFGIAEDEFLFGFVGRITADKGVNEILEAFFSMEKECRLMIVGNREDNTLDESLWNKALNSDKVIIKSSVSDIERYYAALDVLLLPSYREGFGMVIAESAAMGIPSIVSDIPGPVDVIEDGKTALKVKVKDVDDLRQKMNCMIDNGKIEEMRKQCVEFISTNFDSKILNRKILERKTELLK